MSFNRAQLIIFGSIGAIVLLALMLLTGVLPGLENPITRSFTIEVWGFRDPPGVWQEIANAFGKSTAWVYQQMAKAPVPA